MYVKFLSTYSDKKSCHTSTTLQTSIARFVSDSWASCYTVLYCTILYCIVCLFSLFYFYCIFLCLLPKWQINFFIVTDVCLPFWRSSNFSCRHAVSICVSVTVVDHVKTNKRVFKIFSPSGSEAILVFLYQTSWLYFDGNPLNGVSNARGYEKMTIFAQYFALSPKWCKIEPELLWKTNRKPHPSYRMVPVWMILSDL